jgi:hypothetical protein
MPPDNSKLVVNPQAQGQRTQRFLSDLLRVKAGYATAKPHNIFANIDLNRSQFAPTKLGQRQTKHRFCGGLQMRNISRFNGLYRGATHRISFGENGKDRETA